MKNASQIAVKKFVGNFYYVIIPLLILGIPYGFTSFGLSLLALLPLLFVTSRHTVGLFLLMYGGQLGGVIRTMYPAVPIYGILLNAIGLILLWDLVLLLIRRYYRAFIGIFITLLFFGYFYTRGPMNAFATQKFLNICLHGILMLVGFFALAHSKRIDAEGLSRLLIVTSFCLFAFLITTYSFNTGGLFDYEWFRNEWLRYYHSNNQEGTLIGYQHIGMMELFAGAIFLSRIRLKWPKTLFYIICTAQLALMTGCRQAIFGLALIAILRLFFFRRSNSVTRRKTKRSIWMPVVIVAGAVAAGFVLLRVLLAVGGDLITNTLSEGDSGREMLYFQAFSIFQQSPVFGRGLGSFNFITGDPYPHNFILELLCECGLIGTVLALFILLFPFFKYKLRLSQITASHQFFFLIILTILIRVMVSSDFTESIQLYSAVFALTRVNRRRVIRRAEAEPVSVHTDYPFDYSVVIPFHDKYDLFVKAVDSIPDRSDIQIIIVDNAETGLAQDAVPQKSMAEVIYLTSSPQKGAGHARNVGLGAVRGKWLLFLDADDYFTDNAFEDIDKHLDSRADIIYFKPTSINLVSGELSDRHIYYAQQVDKYLKTRDDEFLRYRWEVPWAKLFRSELILNNNIRFDELPVNNDAWFSMLSGHSAGSVSADKSIIYTVTEGRANESLTKKNTPENAFIRFKVAVRINQFLKKNGHRRVKYRLPGFIWAAYKNFGFKEAVRYVKYITDRH